MKTTICQLWKNPENDFYSFFGTGNSNTPDEIDNTMEMEVYDGNYIPYNEENNHPYHELDIQEYIDSTSVQKQEKPIEENTA